MARSQPAQSLQHSLCGSLALRQFICGQEPINRRVRAGCVNGSLVNTDSGEIAALLHRRCLLLVVVRVVEAQEGLVAVNLTAKGARAEQKLTPRNAPSACWIAYT